MRLITIAAMHKAYRQHKCCEIRIDHRKSEKNTVVPNKHPYNGCLLVALIYLFY